MAYQITKVFPKNQVKHLLVIAEATGYLMHLHELCSGNFQVGIKLEHHHPAAERQALEKGRGEPATTLAPGLMKAPPMTFTFSSYIMEKKAF